MIRNFALLVLLLVGGCTAPLRVQETEAPLPPTVPGNEFANHALEKFSRLSREDTLAATGVILDAIRIQQEQIASGNESLIPSYNYLVSRFVKHLERCHIEPWNHPVKLEGSARSYVLHGVEPVGFDASSRNLLPTDMLAYSGAYARERVVKPGIGAPVVAEIPFAVDPKDIGAARPFSKRYVTATAIVRVNGGNAVIQLIDPYSTETVSFAGKTRPLAADFGAAVCEAVSRDRIDKLGLARMLNPEQYADTAYLARLQPYDPQRTPVLTGSRASR